MARVLVTRVSAFGDVALLVPVIYSAAVQYPHDEFIVLTHKAYTPLFKDLSPNISLKYFEPYKHRGFFGLINLLQTLSSGNYSHVADMHDVLRSKIIRFVLGLQGKKVAHIDKGRTEKKYAIRNQYLYPPLKHTTERYRDVLAEIGFPTEISFTNIFQSKNRDFSQISSVVPEKRGKWIGIAPFAKHREKVYPLEKMKKVVSLLAANKDYQLFLFGAGKWEKNIVDEWAKEFDNVISMPGKTDLENELVLISYLDVMVSMDSANMHLASLCQVPVISVWGATHPAIGFYGYKQDLSNAIGVNLFCRPCSVYGNKPCFREDLACLYKIDESVIIQKVESVLSK